MITYHGSRPWAPVRNLGDPFNISIPAMYVSYVKCGYISHDCRSEKKIIDMTVIVKKIGGLAIISNSDKRRRWRKILFLFWGPNPFFSRFFLLFIFFFFHLLILSLYLFKSCRGKHMSIPTLLVLTKCPKLLFTV